MSDANERQIGGQHYNKGDRPQHWDLVAEGLVGRYFEGQITRYIDRHARKNGREDLEKALHYFEKLFELTQQPKPPFCAAVPLGQIVRTNDQWLMFEEFIKDVVPVERTLFHVCFAWHAPEDLEHAMHLLRVYISARYPV